MVEIAGGSLDGGKITITPSKLMQKKVLLGGVDVSDYCLPFELDLAFGDSTHQIVLPLAYTVNSVVTLSNNLRIEVWRGFTTPTDEKVFDGYVSAFELKGISYKLTCNDLLAKAAVGAEVNYNYDNSTDIYAGIASELARDVITKWSGLYAGPYTIDDTTVACWAMQDAVNVQDATVNQITGNVNTALTLTTGTYGAAISFDGATSQVEFNNVPELEITSFTVEAYIKITAVTAASLIVNSKAAGGTNSGWNLGVDAGGHLTFKVANATTTATATGATVLSTGTWYHVAGTYDGTTITVYVAGVSDGTSALVGPATYSGCTLCMGANNSTSYYNGVLDDARVSNDVKTTFSYSDSVISTSSMPDIPSLKCQRVNPLNLLNAFCSEFDYQVYFQPDEGRVHFEPKGYVNTDISLVIGGASANVAGIPKWNNDVNGMANIITLIGFQGLVHNTESFAGPGTTFPLAYAPFNMKVTVGGTQKTGGGFDSTGAVIEDYAVEPVKLDLVFKANSSTIVADYDYQSSIAITQRDNASVATYGAAPKTFMDTGVVTLPAAIARINQLLTSYGIPFLNTEVNVPVLTLSNISVGQIVSVNDTVNNVTGDFLITHHVIKWPSLYDTLVIGNKEWKTAEWGTNVEKKIQSLQQLISGNATHAAYGITAGTPQRFRRKTLTATGWNPGISWVWGSQLDANSKWGAGVKWGKDTTYTPAVLYTVDYY